MKHVIGPYELKEKIGHGGMGMVYRAVDPSLQREVAVKILSVSLRDDKKRKTFEERFTREAQNVAKLDHPNIAKVYYSGIQNNLRFFAMEYIKGKNVADIVEDQGPISVPLTLHITYQTVNALAEAFKIGIIHRDIKPSNIMVKEDFQVKIVDFGLSRLLSETSSITDDGSTFGTPHFMSPEQAKGEPVDFRSDIYSLGITLYFMLSDQYPFTADQPLAILNKHLNEPLPDINKYAPEPLSQDVIRLLTRMTEKKPDMRYQSYIVLLSDLKKLMLRYPFIPPMQDETSDKEPSSGVYGLTPVVADPRQMKTDFEKVMKDGDVFELEEFLIKYPETTYSNLVEEKLNHLRAEQELYTSIEMIDSKEEWQRFLKAYPDGTYAQHVRERIKQLEDTQERRKTQQNRKALLFKRVKEEDDLALLQDFIMQYPNTKEALYAEAKLDKLRETLRIKENREKKREPSSSFVRLIARAEDLIEKKDYRSAMDLLHNILNRKPNHPRATLLLEKVYKAQPRLSPYYKAKKTSFIYLFFLLLALLLFLIGDMFVYQAMIPSIVPGMMYSRTYVNAFESLKPLIAKMISQKRLLTLESRMARIKIVLNMRRNFYDSLEDNRIMAPPRNNMLHYLSMLRKEDRYGYRKLQKIAIKKLFERAQVMTDFAKYDQAGHFYNSILRLDPGNRQAEEKLELLRNLATN